MNNTEEKKLYYKSLADILYKYLEFILSFDKNKKIRFMDIFPVLAEVYTNILNEIEQMEEVHLDSLEAIEKVEEIIESELEKANIIKVSDIKEGLSIEDISNLSIALYLKNYKNSIHEELNAAYEILYKYNTNEAKFLMELISMFKNTMLSTSLTSAIVDDKLMPYYIFKLNISYRELSTCDTYTFIMLNLISGLADALSRFLETTGLTDIKMHDITGHLDCFNSHKDVLNAIYSIDDLSECLTGLSDNLRSFIRLFQDKNKTVSLQPDVKSEK